jgi:hypothetical protein
MFGFSCVLGWMKDAGGPAREGRGEVVVTISTGDLREKRFGIPIAVGSRSSGEQR